MNARRWTALALALALGAAAGGWGIERRARLAAEADLAKALADARAWRKSAREQAQASVRAGSPKRSALLDGEGPIHAGAEDATPAPPDGRRSPALPASDPAGPNGKLESEDSNVQSPPVGSERDFVVDPANPLAEFERIVALWRALPKDMEPALLSMCFHQFRQSLEILANAAGSSLAGPLWNALRSEPANSPLHGILLHKLEQFDPERARQLVREWLETGDADTLRKTLGRIRLLAPDEASAVWARLLSHPDPSIRHSVRMNPPGDGPAFEQPMLDAIRTETEPDLRAEVLMGYFEREPTPQRMDLVLRELERDSNPVFREAVLDEMQDQLTHRDTGAIEVLKRLGMDRSVQRDVRIAALEAILDARNGPLLPAGEVERWQKALEELEHTGE